jgi:hypothetical protein
LIPAACGNGYKPSRTLRAKLNSKKNAAAASSNKALSNALHRKMQPAKTQTAARVLAQRLAHRLCAKSLPLGGSAAPPTTG